MEEQRFRLPRSTSLDRVNDFSYTLMMMIVWLLCAQLNNWQGHVLMYMMACTTNGEPHPFFELQSVDKCGCKQSQLDNRPAVITETSPEKGMEAR